MPTRLDIQGRLHIQVAPVLPGLPLLSSLLSLGAVIVNSALELLHRAELARAAV
jgi:hypothetical protein